MHVVIYVVVSGWLLAMMLGKLGMAGPFVGILH